MFRLTVYHWMQVIKGHGNRSRSDTRTGILFEMGCLKFIALKTTTDKTRGNALNGEDLTQKGISVCNVPFISSQILLLLTSNTLAQVCDTPVKSFPLVTV